MNTLEQLGNLVAHNSFRASLLIVFLLLVRAGLRGRFPARYFHLLWILVGLRLLVPISPASSWSIFNLFSAPAPSGHRVEPRWHVRFDPTPEAALRISKSAETKAAATLDWKRAVSRFGLVAIWLGGVLVQVFLLARAAWAMRRRLRTVRTICEPGIVAIAQQCAEEAGIGREVRIVESDAVSGPAVIGLWRPRLLLPRGLHERLSQQDLRFVLLHEFTHLRRRDLAAMWLLTAARVIHWFNPLVWMAARAARIDAELACDEAVLCRANNPEGYGGTLLKLAGMVSGQRPSIPAVGIIEGKRALRTRDHANREPCPADHHPNRCGPRCGGGDHCGFWR